MPREVDAGSAAGDARGASLRNHLRDAAIVLLAVVAGTAALGAYTTYRIWDVGRHDERRPVDAIVVLGAAQFNGQPSRVLAARLDHAIDLYRQGYAPYFVVTGGKLPGDRTTEAATERAYAIAQGVPASAILAEDTGRTTLESMRHVRALLAERKLSTALFVSDRTHMLRVLRMAQDQGIDAWGSPTATSPTDSDSGLLFESVTHELGALALYLFVEEPGGSLPAPLVGLRGGTSLSRPGGDVPALAVVDSTTGQDDRRPTSRASRRRAFERARRDLARSLQARRTSPEGEVRHSSPEGDDAGAADPGQGAAAGAEG